MREIRCARKSTLGQHCLMYRETSFLMFAKELRLLTVNVSQLKPPVIEH